MYSMIKYVNVKSYRNVMYKKAWCVCERMSVCERGVCVEQGAGQGINRDKNIRGRICYIKRVAESKEDVWIARWMAGT